ncbi:MAG TPA: DNA-processing protein DprA [Candidatus Saccharimonadales bacterium]|nr:DNA-processing protein DprA [Candidatus Saccharimonadales bacterium]
MKFNKLTLFTSDVPNNIRNISSPPDCLHTLGADVKELLLRPCVTVVGSRKVSAYGKSVTSSLTEDLAKAGVVIISGLALGVDSIAHRAALDAGGVTIAVLPSCLDRIYPSSHAGLARQILEKGGALVTEYAEGTRVFTSNFIARNRIASAMGDVLLITEAAEKSGTLHTARFALEQGKEVLAVPGNITSPTSAGTNNLIKSGATPVTSVDDIFYALGLQPASQKRIPTSTNPHEQIVLTLLANGMTDGAELLSASRLEVKLFSQTLTMLEIHGLIRPLGNNHWSLQ